MSQFRVNIVLLFVVTVTYLASNVESQLFSFGAVPSNKKTGEAGNTGGFFEHWQMKQDEKKRLEGKKNIRFALYNKRGNSWIEIKRNGTMTRKWKDEVPLKVLVHGYSKDMRKTSEDIITEQKILTIAHAYGNISQDLNILLVDWTALSVEAEPQYDFVIGNVPIVGEVLTEFLLKLLKRELVFLHDIHIIGYGMGAHVAGVTGKLLQKEKKYGGKVARITGLDPAGVGFDDDTGQRVKDKAISLRKTDAEFVDIIHCNLGVSRSYQDAKWKGRVGSAVQAGHVDFYPNGGSEQLRCKKTSSDDIGEIDKECNTRICPEYFAKSITGKEYLGCKCQGFDDFDEGNCECTLENGGEMMGEPCCTFQAEGKYYLQMDNKNKKDTKKDKDKDKSKMRKTEMRLSDLERRMGRGGKKDEEGRIFVTSSEVCDCKCRSKKNKESE